MKIIMMNFKPVTWAVEVLLTLGVSSDEQLSSRACETFIYSKFLFPHTHFLMTFSHSHLQFEWDKFEVQLNWALFRVQTNFTKFINRDKKFKNLKNHNHQLLHELLSVCAVPSLEVLKMKDYFRGCIWTLKKNRLSFWKHALAFFKKLFVSSNPFDICLPNIFRRYEQERLTKTSWNSVQTFLNRDFSLILNERKLSFRNWEKTSDQILHVFLSFPWSMRK